MADEGRIEVCPDCGNEVMAGANFCSFCRREFTDGAGGSFDDSGDEGIEGFEEDLDRDGTVLSGETGFGTDAADEDDEAGHDHEGEGGEGGQLEDCPNCGTDLSGVPSGMLANCPICGTDLEAVAGPATAKMTPADLTDCPECGTDLGEIPENMRSVCPNCRADLEAIVGEGEATDDDVDAETDEGSVVAEAGPEKWGADVPDSVVLTVRGHEITVGDGDTVGLDIRSAIVESGGTKEDAVYVHREHARFDRHNGDFYVTRLDRNGLRLNGTELDRDERRRVADGDELEFSGVVTAELRLE